MSYYSSMRWSHDHVVYRLYQQEKSLNSSVTHLSLSGKLLTAKRSLGTGSKQRNRLSPKLFLVQRTSSSMFQDCFRFCLRMSSFRRHSFIRDRHLASEDFWLLVSHRMIRRASIAHRQPSTLVKEIGSVRAVCFAVHPPNGTCFFASSMILMAVCAVQSAILEQLPPWTVQNWAQLRRTRRCSGCRPSKDSPAEPAAPLACACSPR